MADPRRRAGLTLVELLLAVIAGALLIAGLMGAIETGLASQREARLHHALVADARFAMAEMVRAVSRTERVLVPHADRPASPQDETRNTALALVLDRSEDLDGDGFPDADDDRDGRIDEDPGSDWNADGAPGIAGIDDDNSGNIDEFGSWDDDEDYWSGSGYDEEVVDGADDDGDGKSDEDPAADMSQDGASGLAGVDDDGDGATDEGPAADDDEDLDNGGGVDEDPLDTVAFFVVGGELLVRLPTPHAQSGTDVTHEVLAEGVSDFDVRWLPRPPGGRSDLVAIELELTLGERSLRLARTVRIGGAL